ncbi:hypothetical protein ACFONC_11380 [Luteimonas soli]|uniref:Uncharacterized protein n=1 Tax=Luteimonas soli TaxID=1648966 RepID=A0ABV7XP34_9GAMM
MATADANRATEIRVEPTRQLRPWRADDLELGQLHGLRVFALTTDTLTNAD